jgi:hypothetical protein
MRFPARLTLNIPAPAKNASIFTALSRANDMKLAYAGARRQSISTFSMLKRSGPHPLFSLQ